MSDKKLIKETLQYFFDGFDNLDMATVQKAFTPEAYLCNLGKDKEFQMVSITEWLSKFPLIKENPQHPFNKEKCRKKIAYIHITGNAASARVLWKFSKFMFTDYYNLLKVNNQWLIVNKTWHTELF